MEDKISIALTNDGALRVYAAVTTSLVSEAQRLHNSYPIATAALGRTLTAAAMMGAMLKNDAGSITIQFKGDGPLGTILAVTTANSEVRGYVANPDVELPLKQNGKLDVGTGVGKNGFLNVVRDSGVGQPYTGQVELVTGEIAEDLTYYYAISEQIPTAMALGVLVDVDLSAKAAGGFMIQLMPGSGLDDENIIDTIEAHLKTIPSVSEMIDSGIDAEGIISKIMGELEYNILDERTPTYKCNCSTARVEGALISIGASDLQSLIDEQNGTTVDCSFCDRKYVFSASDIENLLKKCSK